MVSRLILALAAVIGLASGARAQQPDAAPWSIFSVRYDTRTSDFIYAAYGYGSVFAMAGVLHNPRSKYSEVLGAIGSKFAIGNGPSQFAALGLARASEAWYAQVYFLPTLHRSAFWFRATSELYLPTQRAGTSQFALSPAAVTVEVLPRLEAGMSLDLATAEHAAANTTIGPQLRLSLPNAVVGVDAQRDTKANAGRLRLFFVSAF